MAALRCVEWASLRGRLAARENSHANKPDFPQRKSSDGWAMWSGSVHWAANVRQIDGMSEGS